MYLKCIGGRCDGQKEWVDTDNLKKGDAVRVVEPLKIRTEDFRLSLYETMTKSIVQHQHIYITDCLKYSHKQDDYSEIWFLRPQNLTTFDCIQLQFSK